MLPAISTAVTGEAHMLELSQCCAHVVLRGQLHSAVGSLPDLLRPMSRNRQQHSQQQ